MSQHLYLQLYWPVTILFEYLNIPEYQGILQKVLLNNNNSSRHCRRWMKSECVGGGGGGEDKLTK